MAIPRYRPYEGPILLSAGFRPFFLLAALWAALAIPLWLLTFAGENMVSSVLPATVWHAHEMVFGYGAAVVAGFLLTAIPNWTGRMPLQGGPLGELILLWLTGRAFVLFSASSGATFATVFDLAFPLVFLGVVTRGISRDGIGATCQCWSRFPSCFWAIALFMRRLSVLPRRPHSAIASA